MKLVEIIDFHQNLFRRLPQAAAQNGRSRDASCVFTIT